MSSSELVASPEDVTQQQVAADASYRNRGTYVTLMETSGREFESWYFFLKKEGNEEAIQHLYDQLQTVDWYIRDELSTFDMDIEHPISAEAAKAFTSLCVNPYMPHRKFDGKLQKIDLGFKASDKNKKKIVKTFKKLGYGQIASYISDEDENDVWMQTDSESNSDDDRSEESSSDDYDSSNDGETPTKNPGKVKETTHRKESVKTQEKPRNATSSGGKLPASLLSKLVANCEANKAAEQAASSHRKKKH